MNANERTRDTVCKDNNTKDDNGTINRHTHTLYVYQYPLTCTCTVCEDTVESFSYSVGSSYSMVRDWLSNDFARCDWLNTISLIPYCDRKSIP